jgi:hypothetical protein
MLHQFRAAARLLRTHPGFTAIAVVPLALGIGATTAVFSLIQGILLRPPPYPRADRLMLVSARTPQENTGQSSWPAAQWVDWQQHAVSFEGIAASGFIRVRGLSACTAILLPCYHITPGQRVFVSRLNMNGLTDSPNHQALPLNGDGRFGVGEVRRCLSVVRADLKGRPELLDRLVESNGLRQRVCRGCSARRKG